MVRIINLRAEIKYWGTLQDRCNGESCTYSTKVCKDIYNILSEINQAVKLYSTMKYSCVEVILGEYDNILILHLSSESEEVYGSLSLEEFNNLSYERKIKFIRDKLKN